MPADYRDYEDANREWREKEYELKTALEGNRPKPEIEKLTEEAKELKSHADWVWDRCVDIW